VKTDEVAVPTHVTVLLAVHNGADTVERAIASVVGQDYDDWDLIVVDDASTDGTSGILRRLAEADSRITVLTNERRGGLAYSLNKGWRAARGELIARLDADDACFPDRLRRQVEFMIAHPDVAVLGSGAEIIDADGTARGVMLRPERHEQLADAIYRENPFIHPSVMARRSFFEALGGYDETCKRGQDYDLWTRAYRRFRFHNLQRPLIPYRVRQRLPWAAVVAGTRLAFRLGWRERRIGRGSWYAMRFFIAGILKRFRLSAVARASKL
jgi:glycosyltransferase involved in cell wall biosynthesis